jgi:hypothetical protein
MKKEELTVTYHPKRHCISFTYGNSHQWNIFDVEEGSGTLEIFGRVQYALEHNFNLKMNVEE